jgi:predicted nucleic acid-binding protein
MAASVLADTGFLVALVRAGDGHHSWARHHASRLPRPWHTCEGVISETLHILGAAGFAALSSLLLREELLVSFDLRSELRAVLELMGKYVDVPMDFADACIVRMSEKLPEPVVVTTDTDFRVYRRHGRRVISCVLPN